MDEHKEAEGFARLVLEFRARPLQVGGQMGPPALPGTHLLTVVEGQALWPCVQAGWEGLFLGCSDLACRDVRPGH